MATKEEIDLLGRMISEFLFHLTGVGPSKQICDEFAMKVLAEANQVGFPIDPHALAQGLKNGG